MRGDAALDVAEEARVAAEPAEHDLREEDAEEQPPSLRVPPPLEEAAALLDGAGAQQRLHGTASVHDRQHPAAEEREVALELPRGADALVDLAWPGVPEPARTLRQTGAAARVQLPAPHARP